MLIIISFTFFYWDNTDPPSVDGNFFSYQGLNCAQTCLLSPPGIFLTFVIWS